MPGPDMAGPEMARADATPAAGGRAGGAAMPCRPMRRIFALDDLEAAASRRLPRALFRFVASGSETGGSLRANRRSYEEVFFRPRVLRDVGARRQAVELFGRRHAAPFGIAPMGGAALMGFDADVAMARAAAAAGIPFVLTAAALTPLERVREAAGTRWFAGYLPADRDRMGALVDRVAAAGYEVLVVTADVPVPANREQNLRSGFSMPLRLTPSLVLDGLTHPRWLAGTAARTLLRHGVPHFENFSAGRGASMLAGPQAPDTSRSRLAWDDLAWLRQRWSGPLVVKGILTPEDAVAARQAGADGVIVSNHGGRQLDGAVAPLGVLPSIAAVAGGMAVMIDGGIRRGTDVLKALALGADFAFLGRPFLYAAALAGEAGVAHAIGLLSQEIDRDLALLGCPDIAALDAGYLDGAGSDITRPDTEATR